MGLRKSKLPDEKHKQDREEKQSITDLTVLTYSQMRYICQQTNLIDKEVCRRHDQFLKMTKDGRMSREQWIDVLHQFWPGGNVEKFAHYLFDLCDPEQRGYVDFTRFLVLTHHLRDEKSYLGYLFDMFDPGRNGYLSEKEVPSLCLALSQLSGDRTHTSSTLHIGDRRMAHLYRLLDEDANKRLYRDQFINFGRYQWSDDANGIGILLLEYSC